MEDIERITCVEDDLEAYQGFFDEDWGNDFMKIVRGSKLQEIGFDLACNWQATSNARSLPWLMIKCLDAQQRSQLEGIQPFSNQKIRLFRDRPPRNN